MHIAQILSLCLSRVSDDLRSILATNRRLHFIVFKDLQSNIVFKLRSA